VAVEDVSDTFFGNVPDLFFIFKKVLFWGKERKGKEVVVV